MNERERRRKQSTDELIDSVALEELRAHHPACRLGPVAVVIAAYKEAANIEAVVSSLPSQLCGKDVSVVVVVDGEDDGTGELARAGGAVVAVAPVNRGQGASLRLGYRIARELGAAYVVTADADGQVDPSDLEAALSPVVAGEKDFVSGSRRLGGTEGTDAVRNLGVVVYAGLISALTGVRVTDTANPVRAFRAELSAAFELTEPQYQASELLISALGAGARYGEVPVTMRTRLSGSSKKGGNLAYGYRYGRVVLTTWWRERLRLPRRFRPAR